MWKSHLHQIDFQTTRTTLAGDSNPLSFHQVIDLWQNSGEFRTFFTGAIVRSSFEASFWETPPVTKQTLDRTFEFVLIASPSLSRLEPDSSPFKSRFSSQTSKSVLTFPNLGGDALLLVPKPLADAACYTHLARFLRDAPMSQIDELWQSTGRAMQERISGSPTWLSTSGMGVAWLHLRLDSRPKYYRHESYKMHV